MINTNVSNSTPSSITNHISVEQYTSSNSVACNFYEHNLYHLTGDYVCEKKDWELTSYKNSQLISIPCIADIDGKECIILELLPPIEERDCDQIEGKIIVLSNDEPATFYEIFSYSEDQGLDLRTFNLQNSGSFGDAQTSSCYSALEASFVLIESSTLINAKDKKTYLTLIRSDISFIWRFIKEQLIIELTDTGGEELELLIVQMSKNSRFYWQLLKDHKATDFNFSTET